MARKRNKIHDQQPWKLQSGKGRDHNAFYAKYMNAPDLGPIERARCKVPLRCSSPSKNEPNRRPIPHEVSIKSVREGVRFTDRKRRNLRHFVQVELECVWCEFVDMDVKPAICSGVDKRQISRRWIEGEAKREPATLYYVQHKESFLVFKKSDALQRVFLFENAIPVITYLPKDYFTDEARRKRNPTVT